MNQLVKQIRTVYSSIKPDELVNELSGKEFDM